MMSFRFLIKFICTILLVGLLSTPSKAQEAEEHLLLASQIHSEPLSRKDVRKYLSGQKPLWPDGTPVTILLFPKDSKELKWLCKEIIKIPPPTYRRFLMQKAFRSGINIIEVENQEEAQKVLLGNSGAISPLQNTLLQEEIVELSISK